MIRNGYVLHSATGKYDDADLPAKPTFYGNTEYGRMNMKVVTAPDVAESRWELVYLPSLVTKELATPMGRPDTEGSHRFQVKPESIRTASPAASTGSCRRPRTTTSATSCRRRSCSA